MSIPTFVVVFSGNVLDGFDLTEVKERMSSMIRADEEKIAALFSGRTIVIKRSTNKEEVYKVMTALKAVGADVRIRLIQEQAVDTETNDNNQGAQIDPSDSSLSLSPNVGYLVEPSNQAPAPVLDLSGLTITELNDDLPRQSRNPDRVTIDTSALSLRANDGSPLVEPSLTAPPIASPDFILDEPGSLLDTSPRESAAVFPDTSALSMRGMQGNLLEDAEKSGPVTQAKPDTSHLQTTDSPGKEDS